MLLLFLAFIAAAEAGVSGGYAVAKGCGQAMLSFLMTCFMSGGIVIGCIFMVFTTLEMYGLLTIILVATILQEVIFILIHFKFTNWDKLMQEAEERSGIIAVSGGEKYENDDFSAKIDSKMRWICQKLVFLFCSLAFLSLLFIFALLPKG